MFSAIYPLKMNITPTGFYGDFASAKPLTADVLPHLEERMRALIAQDLPFKRHTMASASVSAAAFLRQYGHPYAAGLLEECQHPLVELIQIGNFADLCSDPCLESSRGVGKIKLFHLGSRLPISLDRRASKKAVFRIEGAAFLEEKQLKKLGKARKELARQDHRVLGEEKAFFDIIVDHRRLDGNHTEREEVSRCCWRHKGLEVIDAFIAYGKAAYRAAGFQLVSHLDIAEELADQRKKKKWQIAAVHIFLNRGEIDADVGLYRAEHGWEEKGYALCTSQELEQALLRSLRQMSKVMSQWGCPVEWDAVLTTGPTGALVKKCLDESNISLNTTTAASKQEKLAKVQGMFIDQFGRRWPGPYLQLEKKNKEFKIVHSLFGRIERFIAFLLESEKEVSQKNDLLSKLKAFTMEWNSGFES